MLAAVASGVACGANGDSDCHFCTLAADTPCPNGDADCAGRVLEALAARHPLEKSGAGVARWLEAALDVLPLDHGPTARRCGLVFDRVAAAAAGGGVGDAFEASVSRCAAAVLRAPEVAKTVTDVRVARFLESASKALSSPRPYAAAAAAATVTACLDARDGRDGDAALDLSASREALAALLDRSDVVGRAALEALAELPDAGRELTDAAFRDVAAQHGHLPQPTVGPNCGGRPMERCVQDASPLEGVFRIVCHPAPLERCV